ncbi:MAG: alpha/beta hydrolase [Sedimentisphaerales bacterium]|nr:alpha/beta hydrolase [Sedimentisphaerales bacterium]
MSKRKHKTIVILLVLVIVTAGSGALWNYWHREYDFGEMGDIVVKIRDELRPIEVVAGWSYPKATQSYFSYFGLDMEKRIGGVEHLFGTFESTGFTLVAHIYKPSNSIGTVVLLHGYLNHSGEYRHLMEALLRQSYAVALYDLPGHGLSSGERGSIKAFDIYTKTLIDFEKIVSEECPGPYHLLGFSTGGAAVIDYLLTAEENLFDKVILAAPLVRSSAWDVSKIGYNLMENFTESVPRANRDNSSDPAFLEFNRTKDVLHCQAVPLQWIKAMFEWNNAIMNVSGSDMPILVIQGDKDGTVDFKYNLQFIKEKFPNARIRMVSGARHELFNESASLRSQAIQHVINYLELHNSEQ